MAEKDAWRTALTRVADPTFSPPQAGKPPFRKVADRATMVFNRAASASEAFLRDGA